jgi:hypothetical protein
MEVQLPFINHSIPSVFRLDNVSLVALEKQCYLGLSWGPNFFFLLFIQLPTPLFSLAFKYIFLLHARIQTEIKITCFKGQGTHDRSSICGYTSFISTFSSWSWRCNFLSVIILSHAFLNWTMLPWLLWNNSVTLAFLMAKKPFWLYSYHDSQLESFASHFVAPI